MYEDLLPHTLPTETERLDQMGRAHDPDTRAAIMRLNLPSDAKCLDIGTGRGSVAIWLAETWSITLATLAPKLIGDGHMPESMLREALEIIRNPKAWTPGPGFMVATARRPAQNTSF